MDYGILRFYIGGSYSGKFQLFRPRRCSGVGEVLAAGKTIGLRRSYSFCYLELGFKGWCFEFRMIKAKSPSFNSYLLLWPGSGLHVPVGRIT